MLADMRKQTEEHFSALLSVGASQLAEDIGAGRIRGKDLAITLGIVSDKLARWHGWEKGMGGAGGDAQNLLYKIFGEAAEGRVKASLTVEPAGASAEPKYGLSGHEVFPEDRGSRDLVVTAEVKGKGKTNSG
jgi:hypothetical protein